MDAPARARRQVDSVEVGGSATAGTGAVDSPPSAAAGTAPAGAASQERAATGDGQAQAGAWLGQFSRPAGAGRGGASGELRLDVLA